MKIAVGKGTEFPLHRLTPPPVTKKNNYCIEYEQRLSLPSGKHLIVRYWHFGTPFAALLLL
jgi:hypothetical protein